MMIKDVPGSKCFLKNSTDGAVRPNASEKELNQVSGNPIQMLTALKVIFQKFNRVFRFIILSHQILFSRHICNNRSYLWTFVIIPAPGLNLV